MRVKLRDDGINPDRANGNVRRLDHHRGEFDSFRTVGAGHLLCRELHSNASYAAIRHSYHSK